MYSSKQMQESNDRIIELQKELEGKDIIIDAQRNTIKDLRALAHDTKAEGHKGKDKIDIIRELGGHGDWTVTEHRKDKETGEVNEIVWHIKDRHVQVLAFILKGYGEGRPVKARELWEKLIKHYGLNIDINAFNGGSNRSRYYFPRYYYVLKILEWRRVVKYGGSGIITLLPEKTPQMALNGNSGSERPTTPGDPRNDKEGRKEPTSGGD